MTNGPKQLNLMEAMDQAKDLVAVFTGVKAQFVAAGWSDLAAEQMVIEIFRKTTYDTP